jgi:hypothetical protein
MNNKKENQPPNLREATTCTDCKHYKYQDLGCGEWEEICQKYDFIINEYLICDDFEEVSK